MKPNYPCLWLEALRSGKYDQTSNHLRTENGFCCLGVMCDIYDSSKWTQKEADGDDTEYHLTEDGVPIKLFELSNETYKQFPPDNILNLFEISPGFAKELTRLNDITENDFEYIADRIEEYYKEKNIEI